MSAHSSAFGRSTATVAPTSHERCRPKPSTKSFMHSSHHDSTAVTLCCLASWQPSSACSGCTNYETLLQANCYLTDDVSSTSCPSWHNFIGYHCDSVLNLSRPFWTTRRWMVCFRMRNVVDCKLTTTFGRRRLPLSNVTIRVRWQEFTQARAIAHSLLLGHVSGTTDTSPSTWFWTYSLWVPPVSEDAPGV